jgi:sRNA-binding regulator protein Hfq
VVLVVTPHDATGSTVSVRDISQREFDALVPAQQAFYLNLIEQGRVRITPDAGTIPPVPEKKRDRGDRQTERKTAPLDRLVGRPIRILLTNRQHVEGTLAEVSQFEAVLATGTDPLIVLKHAMVTVEEVSGPGQSQLPITGGA